MTADHMGEVEGGQKSTKALALHRSCLWRVVGGRTQALHETEEETLLFLKEDANEARFSRCFPVLTEVKMR